MASCTGVFLTRLGQAERTGGPSNADADHSAATALHHRLVHDLLGDPAALAHRQPHDVIYEVTDGTLRASS